MGIDIDVHKIPNDKAFASILISFASIIAPFWFIYQFDRALFLKQNTFNLLILSSAIGLPVLIANTIIFWLLINGKMDDKEWPRVTIITSLMSFVCFYAPSIYTIKGNVPLKDATYITAGIEFGLIFTMLFAHGYKIREQHKADKRKKLQPINTPADPGDPLPPNPLPETPNDI